VLNLLARLFAPRPAPARRPGEARLRLEGLETRVVPAVKHLPHGGPIHHQISYIVDHDELNAASRNTIKKTMKKNILTLRNLPPGNYSASYSLRTEVDH
jgi:hypothetical protein